MRQIEKLVVSGIDCQHPPELIRARPSPCTYSYLVKINVFQGCSRNNKVSQQINASLLAGLWLRRCQHHADLLLIVQLEHAAVCHCDYFFIFYFFLFCSSLPLC